MSGPKYIFILLKSLSDMLPFFATAAHYDYAKFARLHLQFMLSLEIVHPGVCQSFVSGLHSSAELIDTEQAGRRTW